MYLSVRGEAVTERIVEKSRFIAFVAHTSGGAEAKAFLARVRGEHPQATHVCYGYVADAIGNEQRFSDAGEPQGTAGMPILSVLKARKLYETTVAVVRYFGGIKLGAGGLTRAYSASAAEGCDAAEICEYGECVRVSMRVAYPEVSAITRFLDREGTVYERSFGESAEFIAVVREDGYAGFKSRLNEMLNGRVEITEGERKIFPFPKQ